MLRINCGHEVIQTVVGTTSSPFGRRLCFVEAPMPALKWWDVLCSGCSKLALVFCYVRFGVQQVSSLDELANRIDEVDVALNRKLDAVLAKLSQDAQAESPEGV
jgi:hypothetical protein